MNAGRWLLDAADWEFVPLSPLRAGASRPPGCSTRSVGARGRGFPPAGERPVPRTGFVRVIENEREVFARGLALLSRKPGVPS